MDPRCDRQFERKALWLGDPFIDDGYGPTTAGIFRIVAIEYRRDFPPG